MYLPQTPSLLNTNERTQICPEKHLKNHPRKYHTMPPGRLIRKYLTMPPGRLIRNRKYIRMHAEKNLCSHPGPACALLQKNAAVVSGSTENTRNSCRQKLSEYESFWNPSAGQSPL
jgi:hypothetical protein